MRHSHRGSIVCAWVIIALAGVAFTESVPLRLILGAPLLFLLPGYSLSRVLDVRAGSALERFVLAGGVSVATVIGGGFVLNAINFLTPLGWATWLGGLTVTAVLFAAISGAAAVSPERMQRWPADFRLHHALALVVAALVSCSAFSIAVHDESEDRQFRFTEFWMVPGTPGLTRALTIGVRNAETAARSFDIELMMDGRLLARRQLATLEPGETFLEEIPIPAASDPGHKMEAWLFRDGNKNIVYRKVSFAMGPG